MRETNRHKLYSYSKQYIRAIDTRQDILFLQQITFLDPKTELILRDKMDSRLNHLEKDIKTIVNDNEESTTIQKLLKICIQYNIPFKDLPEVLEEYIATDNEEYLEKLRSQKQ